METSCQYTTFKHCVSTATEHCETKLTKHERTSIFHHWNKDKNNAHRFSYDEMLCMSEAIESGQDFCPSPMIIEQLDACLKESEEGKLQAPSESDLPPGAVVCRFSKFKRCVDMRIGDCHKTWELWQQWNVNLEVERQFSLLDQQCVEVSPSSSKFQKLSSLLIATIILWF